MAYVTEILETRIAGAYDVIVVGGGPAGTGAALAAARHGKKTLVIERFSCMGGMWTSGLVNPLFDYEGKGGIVEELVRDIDAAGMSARSGYRYYTFDMEFMKLLIDRKMRQAGVDVLFHTYFALPILSDGAVTGVIVENKGGRMAFLGERVIDCTGDGDVAARAGAPWSYGRDGDHAVQPMTLMFKISNMEFVQQYPYPGGNDLYQLMKRAVEHDNLNYEFNFVNPCLLRLPGRQTGVLQMTHMRGLSAIDPWNLSAAEMEGRERVDDAMRFFKSHLQQFANVQLDQTAATIGVRESRRITGEYEMTLADMEIGRTFRDGFTTCRFGVDIHQPDGKSQEENRKYQIKPYQIPYRCLVPLSVQNLLVAGRCISGSYEAHASYRVTGDCVAMGQAAGTAAALSLDATVAPRALDGKHVVDAMIEDGAIP